MPRLYKIEPSWFPTFQPLVAMAVPWFTLRRRQVNDAAMAFSELRQPGLTVQVARYPTTPADDGIAISPLTRIIGLPGRL